MYTGSNTTSIITLLLHIIAPTSIALVCHSFFFFLYVDHKPYQFFIKLPTEVFFFIKMSTNNNENPYSLGHQCIKLHCTGYLNILNYVITITMILWCASNTNCSWHIRCQNVCNAIHTRHICRIYLYHKQPRRSHHAFMQCAKLIESNAIICIDYGTREGMAFHASTRQSCMHYLTFMHSFVHSVSRTTLHACKHVFYSHTCRSWTK